MSGRPRASCRRLVVDGSQARQGGVEQLVAASLGRLAAQGLGLEFGERSPTCIDRFRRLVTARCLEVVSRLDGLQPAGVTGEIGVGFLELGVRGPSAVALLSQLGVEVGSALYDFLVLVAALALKRLDHRCLLLGVRERDGEHLALAVLFAQAREDTVHPARRFGGFRQ